uniref:Retrotransposon gag domain-containing protein n=1 Tax=Noccaea caerulescens TaxID=107243 RepID=A0A1J3K0A7_NOCCA
MVKSWLLNSVMKKIYASILYFRVSADIWKDLHTRFHKSNLPRLYKLRHQLHSLRQGTMDLSSYHTQTQTYWEELSSLQVTSRTVEALLTERETNQVIDFLMGLNDCYDNIKSQILMKKTLPSLSEVFNILDNDDSQRSARTVPKPSTFQIASNSYAPHEYQKSRPVCSHCGGLGHIVDRCYKKHGYPPGLKNKGIFQKPSISTNMIINPEPSVTQSESAPSVNYANVPHAALTPDQMQQFIAYFSTQLHNHSITPPTPAPEGLPTTTLAVPSTSKVSGSYSGIDDWQG